MNQPNNTLARFPVLTTRRLILRQLIDTDIYDLIALRSDDGVNQYLDRPKSMTAEEATAFVKKINNELTYWAISLTNSKKLIGAICLWNIDTANETADVGYELSPGLQGKGLMFEALAEVVSFGFAVLHFKLINGYTHKDNKRSKNLLERLGFNRNHALENELYKNDGQSDEVVYTLKAPLQ